MKKTMFLIIAACSLVACAATKVATQDWVRRFVGSNAHSLMTVQTNATGRQVSYSMLAEDDAGLFEVVGNGGAAAISANQQTNLIFKAVASNVSGVPSGTVWRVMGLYLNSANPIFPQLTARAWMQGSSRTWRLFGTNTQTRAEFTSVTDGGYWYLTATETPSQRIKLIPLRVSDEEARRAYMADIARSRMHEMMANVRALLFPSAYAEWRDPVPGDPLAYDWQDFVDDFQTCDVFYISGIELSRNVNGKSVKYTARFGELGDFDGRIIGDFSVLPDNVLTAYSKEYFLDTRNWNLPFAEGVAGNAKTDKMILYDDDGETVSCTRGALEKMTLWQDFAFAMYESYIARIAAMMTTHECTANPKDECRCVMFDSIHCPAGRGKGSRILIDANSEVVRMNADKIHDWKTVGGCKVCRNGCGEAEHAHTDEHCVCDCGDDYKHVPKGAQYCRCECGQIVIAHVPHVSRCGCECGGAAGFHKPKSQACGCLCGEMDNSSEKSWHPHALKDTSRPSGEKVCNCYCGNANQHEFEESNLCPDVCGCCHVMTRNKLAATIENHREMDTSRANNYPGNQISRCGCECGHMLVTNETVAAVARFHYEKPGTCMCYGANGQGGEWHFPHEANGCTGVCSKDHDGIKMKVAKPLRGDKCERGVEMATLSDHEALANNCGCKCGEYSTQKNNIPESLHKDNPNACGCCCGQSNSRHHVFATGSCVCMCSDPDKQMHRADFMSACPDICGNCGRVYMKGGDEPVRNAHGETILNHAQAIDSCGCKCGKYSAAKNNLSGLADKFHVLGNPSDCWCVCNNRHIGARKGNSATCDYCNNCDLRMDDSKTRRESTTEGHVKKSQSCECVCGTHRNGQVGGHEKRPDECECYCRGKKYDHEWKYLVPPTQYSSYTCDECGNFIKVKRSQEICDHCNKLADEVIWEEGHGRHDNGEEPAGEPKKCGCGCSGCTCSSCLRGWGTCTTCGDKCNGGGDGESGSGEGIGKETPADAPLNI